MPRQHSSGERQLLLGITKRGDRYLRTLLIHGARSTVRAAQKKNDSRSRWINVVTERIAAVAVANKNVRILWAMLVTGEEYRAAKLFYERIKRRGKKNSPAIALRPGDGKTGRTGVFKT